MKKLLFLTVVSLFSINFLVAQNTAVAVIIAPLMVNDSTSFKEYCGVYKMAENPYVSEVTIELKDGKLVSKTPDDEEVVLEFTENDTFFIAPLDATAVFQRENGVVKSVKVTVRGKEMMGEKK